MAASHLRSWRYVLPLAIAILVAGSSWWRTNQSVRQTNPGAEPLNAIAPSVPPLEQDPQIQVFFNHSEASVYRDPYRQIARHGDNLEAVITDTIKQADTSVDIAVQALNLPLVAQALIESHHQGVRIRLILDNQYSQPWSQAIGEPAATEILAAQLADWQLLADANQDGQIDSLERLNADALFALKTAGVPQIDDTADGSKGSDLMHHKFLIADERWVVTGSANYTLSGIHGDAAEASSRGNANSLLKIDSKELAQQMTAEFNLMWGDGPGGSTDSRFGLQKPARAAYEMALGQSTLKLQFSPLSTRQPWEHSVSGLIAQTLSQASKSIHLALFVFSEQKIANQLEIASSKGIDLRVLIDKGFIYRSYSEALDLIGKELPNQRCNIEENNRPWSRSIDSVRSPHLPRGDKLHHKFATVDDSIVIAGSQNWSQAANTGNDETLLVIRNPTVVAHFNREFERLYSTVSSDDRTALQRKLLESKQRCR